MNKTNETFQTEGVFEGWAILELMGHRKLGGYLTEQTIAGAAFVRIDVVNMEGIAIATQFYSGSAIYCITPTTQDVATAFGSNHKPEPVTRWELPTAKINPQNDYGYQGRGFDEGEDGEDDVFGQSLIVQREQG